MEYHYNEKFLVNAIELAEENVRKGAGGPFGAVVVKDGEVIADSGNSVTVDKDPTAHAEINVIRKACKLLNDFQLTGCQIYASCEPCPMCLGAIYWARPDVVFFAATKQDAAHGGFDDAFIYDEINKNSEHRSIPFIRKNIKQCTHVFNQWLNLDQKKSY